MILIKCFFIFFPWLLALLIHFYPLALVITYNVHLMIISHIYDHFLLYWMILFGIKLLVSDYNRIIQLLDQCKSAHTPLFCGYRDLDVFNLQQLHYLQCGFLTEPVTFICTFPFITLLCVVLETEPRGLVYPKQALYWLLCNHGYIQTSKLYISPWNFPLECVIICHCGWVNKHWPIAG